MKINCASEEKNERTEQINENTTIHTESTRINGQTGYYEMTFLIRDSVRKGNKGDIRHFIKISSEVMDNGKIKIPSIIKVEIKILNNVCTNNIFIINQVSDDILLSYENSLKKITKTHVYDCKADDIIEYIKNYLYSFNGLKGDEDFELALERASLELKEFFEELLELWSNFDFELYLKKQKDLIKGLEAEFLAKISPIKDLIQVLKMRDDKNFELILKTTYPELVEIVEQISKLGDKFNYEEFINRQQEQIKLCELNYLNIINPIKNHVKFLLQITNDLNENKTKRK